MWSRSFWRCTEVSNLDKLIREATEGVELSLTDADYDYWFERREKLLAQKGEEE